MSLLGESGRYHKMSPAQGLTKLRFILHTNNAAPANLRITGYAGAEIAFVSPLNVIFVDLPTTFNNLYQVTVNPQTGDSSATLLYHTGDIQLPFAGLAAQGGRIVFFNQPDVAPPTAVAKDKTRIWFTFINSLGVSYIPTDALAYIELGIASQKIQGIAVA